MGQQKRSNGATVLTPEGIMREEVEVSIYKLKNGGYQASYLNPFSKKRIRNKFKMLNEANDFKRKIHAQFITDESKKNKAPFS